MKNYIKMKHFISPIYLILVLVLTVFSCTKDNIIDAPHFPPPAVEGFEVTPGNGEVTLNWLKGNTSLITNYSLSYTPSDGEPIIIPNTETSYTVNGLVNDQEYTFTLVAQKTIQTATQSSEAVTVTTTPFEPNLEGPEITSFTFLAASNPDMALEATDRVDLTGTIDLDNNTITFSDADVSAYIYRDKLVATFEVETGATVSVGGTDQTSGTSVQDFTSPLQYVVTKDGQSRTFTVTVNKNFFATIPDDAFRAFLIGKGLPFNAENQLETNAQAVIDYEAGSKFNIDNVGISNVKGVEFFVSVREIDSERNSFPSINISRNAAIEILVTGLNSELSDIQIGDLTQLIVIYVNDTPKLTKEVVQPILDANPNIYRFYNQGVATGLTDINVENLVKMERLRLNESTAKASAASINTLLSKNPPIATDLGNLRIYKDGDGTQCSSYDPTTYECN